MTAKPPFFSRISVRMTVLIAVMLFGAHLVGPPLHRLILSRVDPHPGGGDPVLVRLGSSDEDGASSVSEEALASMPSHVRAAVENPPHMLARRLIDSAQPLPSGGYLPSDEVLDSVGKDIDRLEGTFAWLSPTMKVVAQAGGAPFRIGSKWPLDLFEETSVYIPAAIDGSIVGWLVVMPKDDLETVDVARIIEHESRHASIEKWTERILAALITIAVAALTSWFVTRRLRRLAAAVASEDPVRFQSHVATDEIGSLARAIQSERIRVAQLTTKLQERDERRRQWLSQLSHDLRTPLTALIAGITRARSEAAQLADVSGGTVRLSRAIEAVAVDTDRVSRLADDLIEIARLDAEESLCFEEILPGELIDRVIAGLFVLAESRGLELTDEIEAGLPLVLADGHRVTRALENLVRNAIRYATRRITLSASSTAGGVEFAVRDDGPGFADCGPGEVDLERVAETPRPQGGLGLVVVGRIAEAHGGKAAARNLTPRGASVSFLLPEVPAEELEVAAGSDMVAQAPA